MDVLNRRFWFNSPNVVPLPLAFYKNYVRQTQSVALQQLNINRSRRTDELTPPLGLNAFDAKRNDRNARMGERDTATTHGCRR